MSHATERKEKNCLNCGTTVVGRYCHICGQENLEPKESLWHLVVHFFNDITHFDGKFFSTLKFLIIRPGFLSREYMLGRRNSYLNPVRMYIFTSAIFFLIFFSIEKQDEDILKTETTVNGVSLEKIAAMDSVTFSKFTAAINKEDKKGEVPMTREEFKKYVDTAVLQDISFTTSSRKYKTREEYDSLIKAGVVKDGWLARQFQYKEISIRKRYGNDSKAITRTFKEIFLHSLPQMLFISLPLLALLFKLLYIRRKEYYYVSHGIFSIHLYIFIFIVIMLQMGISSIHSLVHSWLFSFINVCLGLYIFVYTFIAMKRFYKQGAFKTTIKFLLLLFFYLLLLIFLALFFVFFSFYKI